MLSTCKLLKIVLVAQSDLDFVNLKLAETAQSDLDVVTLKFVENRACCTMRLRFFELELC